MGWCSGTVLFDAVCDALIAEPAKKATPEDALRALIDTLEDQDWDCQQDSAYWSHPLVRKIMRERHPSWFEDEDQP